ncbi:MAG: metal-dependent hydrolase [Acidobacteria bacterium]|nr:MAG: metal-dependent hydrolase [Acidobacteriota bacterium]
MDNLTHSLVAASLGRAGLSDKIPGGTFSLIVAANLADLDIVASFWGNLYYLAHHRGITHSIVGTAGLAALLVAVLWLVGRFRGHPASLARIALAVGLTAATHPLLDLTNSYGLRPFLPFTDHWYYGDLVFIIDPYIWLLLGGTLFVTGTRSRLTTALWLAGGALASAVVLFGAVNLGLWLTLAIWVAGLAAAVLVRRNGLRPVSWAGGALAVVVMYWGLLAVVHWETLRRYYPEVQARYPSATREAVSAIPRAANPLEWDLYVELPNEIGYALGSSFSDDRPEFETTPRNTQHPAAVAAMATCPGAVFTHFARFEVFEVEETGDGPIVTIKDVRFARLARNRGFGTVSIRPDSASEIPCPGKPTRREDDLRMSRK